MIDIKKTDRIPPGEWDKKMALLESLMASESMPHHHTEKMVPTPRYLNSKLVATCFICRGDNKKFRVQIDSKYIFCPDCKTALFWERLQEDEMKSPQRRSPTNSQSESYANK
jgi:hypothetical protein